MFDAPIYISSNLNIIFARKSNIRKNAYRIEDILEEKYDPAQILPIPDAADASHSRIILTSKHKYSRISFSQQHVNFQVNYDENFNRNRREIEDYLKDKVTLLFDVLRDIKANTYFSGMGTAARLEFNGTISGNSDNEIVEYIQQKFNILNIDEDENTQDIEYKKSKVFNNTFYSNELVRNFRQWTIQLFDSDVVHNQFIKISNKNAQLRGIEIEVDYNDRYAYNEHTMYKSDVDAVMNIIQGGLDQTDKLVNFLREDL